MIVYRQTGGEFYASIHAYHVWHQELQNSSSIQQSIRQPGVADYLFMPIDTKAQAAKYPGSLIRSQTPHYAFAFPIHNRCTFHLRKNVA
jgi:hypothetical protein